MENNEVEKKKRGRKPKGDKPVSSANCTSTKENDSFDPQILHLNITRKSRRRDSSSHDEDTNFESHFCTYDPEIIIPNAYNEHDNFTSQPFELIPNKSVDSFRHTGVKTMMQNIDNKFNTDVACYWCCHKFENEHLGMPIKYRNGVFEVVGCFCSFECMCAYNFYSNENNHNIWEVYNLINIMSNKMNYEKCIYPAPPRKCLTMFGGYMTIDDFRNFKNSKKIINLNLVPLTTLVDQIEEVNDFYHTKNKYESKETLFNFDHERIHKLEKQIHLENKQNIERNFANTLDVKMMISQ